MALRTDLKSSDFLSLSFDLAIELLGRQTCQRPQHVSPLALFDTLRRERRVAHGGKYEIVHRLWYRKKRCVEERMDWED